MWRKKEGKKSILGLHFNFNVFRLFLVFFINIFIIIYFAIILFFRELYLTETVRKNFYQLFMIFF